MISYIGYNYVPVSGHQSFTGRMISQVMIWCQALAFHWRKLWDQCMKEHTESGHRLYYVPVSRTCCRAWSRQI